MTAPGPQAHHLRVSRTARYYVLGPPEARETWFVLHGYGQQARFFLRHFRPHAGPQRRFVAPEALSRFYLDDRYERIGASWMTREDREADISDTIAYLDALAAHVGSGSRCCLFGFSQGAAAACRWAALGTRAFARVVLWGGEVPPDLDLARTGDRLRDLTLVWGDADTYATPARVAATEARLASAGVPYRVVRYAGEHRLYAGPLAALMEEGP